MDDNSYGLENNLASLYMPACEYFGLNGMSPEDTGRFPIFKIPEIFQRENWPALKVFAIRSPTRLISNPYCLEADHFVRHPKLTELHLGDGLLIYRLNSPFLLSRVTKLCVSEGEHFIGLELVPNLKVLTIQPFPGIENIDFKEIDKTNPLIEEVRLSFGWRKKSMIDHSILEIHVPNRAVDGIKVIKAMTGDGCYWDSKSYDRYIGLFRVIIRRLCHHLKALISLKVRHNFSHMCEFDKQALKQSVLADMYCEVKIKCDVETTTDNIYMLESTTGSSRRKHGKRKKTGRVAQKQITQSKFVGFPMRKLSDKFKQYVVFGRIFDRSETEHFMCLDSMQPSLSFPLEKKH